MAVIDPRAPLKVDKPRAIERTDGDTVVSRHFEDGTLRITVYDQHGGARIVTHRKNPSTGADEKTTQNNDGSVIKETSLPDGSSTMLEISPTGAETRTALFHDANGNPSSTVTFPDGTTQTDVTIRTPDGFRIERTNPDGTKLLTETKQVTQQNGDVLTSMIASDGTGKILNSQTTLQRPDGSEEITNLADGKPTSIIQRITLPDGATRERVHDFEKNTIETTVSRSYTKDGNTIKEVLGENDVKITTTRPDGSTSNVTKFDDGTQEATDFVIRPDGSRVFTTTNRENSFETVEHLAAKPGEPLRVVTTNSDGTRTEQTLDDERMTTTIRNTDGTSTVVRRDMDGVGSRADFDAQGTQTSLTTIDGEPVEPFPGFTPPDGTTPTPPPTPSPTPEPSGDADGNGAARERVVEEQIGGGTQPEQQDQDGVQPAAADGAPTGQEATRPEAAEAAPQELDPVSGEPLRPDIAGRGVALEPEVAARIAAEQAAPAASSEQAVPDAPAEPAAPLEVAREAEGVATDQPAADAFAPSETVDVTASQLEPAMPEAEAMPEPQPIEQEPEPIAESGTGEF